MTEKSVPELKGIRQMIFSFWSPNPGDRYLKGLRRRDSSKDLEYYQNWEKGKTEGETSEAYNVLILIVRRLFKKDPSEIDSILRGLDLQELRRLRNIAFDCASYEEFVGIVKAQEAEI